MRTLDKFAQVWCVDFEYGAPPGERPEIRCMVAAEYYTGKIVRLWIDDLEKLSAPPFPVDESSLFVAYYAGAEFSCLLQLGWGMPARVLDLFTEFRNHTNGRGGKAGLIDALQYFGLSSIEAVEKDAMRDLALRGGVYSEEEKLALLDYCQSDVDALMRLLPRMLPLIDLPRAILRGRYMVAISRMEHIGVPLDTEIFSRLCLHWKDIQTQLIEAVDKDYRVYDGRTFKTGKFEVWLVENGIPWPRLPTGRLDLSDNTFKDMAKSYPAVVSLRELRTTLSRLRLNDLAVGADGYNRSMLSAFRARTGRNQPSNSTFIYGPSAWLRGLTLLQKNCTLPFTLNAGQSTQQSVNIQIIYNTPQGAVLVFQSGTGYYYYADTVYQSGVYNILWTKRITGNSTGPYNITLLQPLASKLQSLPLIAAVDAKQGTPHTSTATLAITLTPVP